MDKEFHKIIRDKKEISVRYDAVTLHDMGVVTTLAKKVKR